MDNKIKSKGSYNFFFQKFPQIGILLLDNAVTHLINGITDNVPLRGGFQLSREHGTELLAKTIGSRLL